MEKKYLTNSTLKYKQGSDQILTITMTQTTTLLKWRLGTLILKEKREGQPRQGQWKTERNLRENKGCWRERGRGRDRRYMTDL